MLLQAANKKIFPFEFAYSWLLSLFFLKGVRDFLKWLQKEEKKFIFLTNASEVGLVELSQKIHRLTGFNVSSKTTYIYLKKVFMNSESTYDFSVLKPTPLSSGSNLCSSLQIIFIILHLLVPPFWRVRLHWDQPLLLEVLGCTTHCTGTQNC